MSLSADAEETVEAVRDAWNRLAGSEDPPNSTSKSETPPNGEEIP